MTQLQLALDAISLDDALAVLEDIHTQIDIVEVGTPFMIRYGMQAVRAIKERFPSLQLLCDGKIMDAGSYESQEMFDAGADWVTVMAFTDTFTIRECVKTAHALNKKVMADLLCINDIPSKVQELEALDVDCIAVHTGVDQQLLGHTPLGELRILRACASKSMVAVAGGVNLDTLDEYLSLKPDILIVGGGILNHEDRTSIAGEFHRRITRYGG